MYTSIDFFVMATINENHQIVLLFGECFGNPKDNAEALIDLTKDSLGEKYITSEFADRAQIITVREGTEEECKTILEKEHTDGANVAASSMKLRNGGLVFG